MTPLALLMLLLMAAGAVLLIGFIIHMIGRATGETQNLRICDRCTHANRSNARYCASCGARLPKVLR